MNGQQQRIQSRATSFNSFVAPPVDDMFELLTVNWKWGERISISKGLLEKYVYTICTTDRGAGMT